MNFVFKTRDCPTRVGREPIEGETEFTIHMPLDDGGDLAVKIGREGMAYLGAMVMIESERHAGLWEDVKEAYQILAETPDDGSVRWPDRSE